jgi:hypothetical protein
MIRPAGEDPQTTANRQTRSLAGLAAALLIVVAGLYLAHRLHEASLVQDCALAGGIGCAPLDRN